LIRDSIGLKYLTTQLRIAPLARGNKVVKGEKIQQFDARICGNYWRLSKG
jgi:hypothetical protein